MPEATAVLGGDGEKDFRVSCMTEGEIHKDTTWEAISLFVCGRRVPDPLKSGEAPFLNSE